MRQIIFVPFLVFFVLSSVAIAAERPEILLYEVDSLQKERGTSSPIFVHYSSGLTIFWTGLTYMSVVLDEEESTALLSNLSSIKKLSKKYTLHDKKYGSTIELHFRDLSDIRKITIHGRDSATEQQLKGYPGELDMVVELLRTYSHPKAKELSAAYLEVIIWPYEGTLIDSVKWPDDWPDIKSDSTIKRSETSYSLYIPWKDKNKLPNLFEHKYGFLINEKIWSREIRIPFPHETSHIM